MNLTFSLMPHSPDLDDTDLKFLDKLIRSPISGPFYRYRFQMALDALLPPYERVLEIGYGSGLLAFVLAPVTEEYVAVDIHSQPEKVELSLKEQGRTNVKCNICDARNLSQYEAEYFDLVVSVSCLEHIRETIEVQKEVHRVLKAGGKAVYGLPIKNVMTKILFRLVG
jgi:ubiquinone/menaquinone biosynthesis C-methylase UbiE